MVVVMVVVLEASFDKTTPWTVRHTKTKRKRKILRRRIFNSHFHFQLVVSEMRSRYLVGIQYNGWRYSGWSSQEPSKRTKKGIVYTLHQGLEQFLQKKYLNLMGSSRTDAGVHAVRNYFHFDIQTDQCKSILTPEKIVRGLNTHLREEDIQILNCREVPLDFDSRRNATSRTYMYRLMTTADQTKLSKQWLFQDQNVWYVKPLNVKAMKEAAQHLIGIHDYTTFRNRDCQSQSTFRHLWRLEIESFGSKTNALIHDPFLIVS
jgi:tRNA pseudouridine38-40 synthase